MPLTEARHASSLRALLSEVLPHATPRVLGRLILAADPQIARIAPEQRDRLVDAALGDGESMAGVVSRQWGPDPERVAQQIGLPVVDSQEEGGYGSTVVYAEYGGRRPRIVLYRLALARLDRQLAQHETGEQLGLVTARPVYLSHELYHHFDLARAQASIAQRTRVVQFRLGRFRWTSGVAALAEIAAGAFAQRLLGLRFHPKLLDLVPVYETNQASARRMARALATV
jgi:hypothetical protein